jgi:Na+/H+ antiporter NhaD/arsenite permease-like protein
MDDITITFAIVAAVVVLFVWGRVPVEVVAVGAAVALWATGVLSLEQALAGFGDPTVLFIASLFVVSEALDATGVTTWVGQRLIAWAGDGRTRLLVLMMLIVALLTALISVNGAVAALLPVVVVIAVRLRRAPSQLLMPLVFFSHAGSLLALTGTPVHVIIVEASRDAGAGGFGYFSFALVGIPVLLAVTAIVVLFGERLLPTRIPPTCPRMLVPSWRSTPSATACCGCGSALHRPSWDVARTPSICRGIRDSRSWGSRRSRRAASAVRRSSTRRTSW